MGATNSGRKLILAETKRLGKVSSEQRNAGAVYRDVDRKHGRKPHNIVAPEHPFDSGQVGLIQIAAVARRLEI